jgi:ribosomal protein L37E
MVKDNQEGWLMRCPRCGGHSYVYKKLAEVRYRKCGQCGFNVVTVEIERYIWESVLSAAKDAGLDTEEMEQGIREGVMSYA